MVIWWMYGHEEWFSSMSKRPVNHLGMSIMNSNDNKRFDQRESNIILSIQSLITDLFQLHEIIILYRNGTYI